MKKEKRSISIVLAAILLLLISCSKNDTDIRKDDMSDLIEKGILPVRSGPRPETTMKVPHVQIDVELVPEVHDEMIRRVYAIPGIDDGSSFIMPWRGLLLGESVEIVQAQALISGREFAHIHTDGSLHIFLEPNRASEAVETGWAVFHPSDFDGFVMLYTPQSIDELAVTFQLIVDAFNYITGQEISATDYYD